MVRYVPFPFEGNRFPAGLGAVVQLTVLHGQQPARVIVHASDGSWLVGDGVNDPDAPGACIATHILHVVERDVTVSELASLPPGKMAERVGPNSPWKVTDHHWEGES